LQCTTKKKENKMNLKNYERRTRTKLVATAGPTFEGYEQMKEVITKGVNVVRLNTSHGDEAEHGARIKDVKKLRKELNLPISILLDTKGPEIRTGGFVHEDVRVVKGTRVIVTTEDVTGDEKLIPVSYNKLPQSVEPGQKILIDDGKLILLVKKVLDNKNVETVAQNTHVISKYRGVNIPGIDLQLPFISAYDKKFIL
jgi:pyruvate kinase